MTEEHIEIKYCRLRDAGKWDELKDAIENFPWETWTLTKTPEQALWMKEMWLKRAIDDREYTINKETA